MTAQPQDDPQPVLAYADAVTRWGVGAQTDGRVTRVVVPPLPGWRYLGAWYYIGGAVLGVIVLGVSVQAVRMREPTGLIGVAVYGSGLFALILVAFYRMHRRLVLEVDDRQFSVRSSHPWLVSPRSWPRASVVEVRQNRSNGKLMVRIAGEDHVDVFISPVRQVTMWVAQTIDDALRGTPRASLPPSPSLPPPLQHHGGARSRWARLTLIATGVAMIAGGMTMLFLGLPWNVLAIYVLIFSAAPFGMALGTQKKEFYL